MSPGCSSFTRYIPNGVLESFKSFNSVGITLVRVPYLIV